MNTTVIRNAQVMAVPGGAPTAADILVRGRLIEAVAPGLVAPDGAAVIDARGMLAMPGLINAHVHSPGNLMRGMLDCLPLEIFMLYEVPPLSRDLPVKRLNYLRTLLGAIEMLKLGVTAVMDDAFHVPVASVDGIDGIMEAYRDSFMRARVAIDQPNVIEYEKYPFLRELLPDTHRRAMEQASRQSGEELIELYRHLIARWHGEDAGRIGAALSCSAPQRVTVEYFQALSRLGAQHDLPFNVHILETKLQRVLGAEKYGKSLVRYVADLGLLDERMVVIHAIWVDDADIALLAKARAMVAHNPICNLRLGSGVMPFRRLRDAGVTIALGTDEATVDDTHNLWGAMKLAGMVHTLSDPDYARWPRAGEVLEAVLAGGARALRIEGKVGAIAPGHEADLILVDLDTLAFTPLNDLDRQLVYCENGGSVRLTMVAGRIVARDGRVLSVDEEAVKREIRALMPGWRAQMADALRAARELEPHYRAMYLRAAETPVGINRWIGG
jgi:cytosine/adenosine deaminase-related metal-dependent hydrolase